MLAAVNGGVASCHISNLFSSDGGLIHIDSKSLYGSSDSLGSIATIRAARKSEVEFLVSSGGEHALIIDCPGRLWAAEFAAIGKLFDRVPIIFRTHDMPTCARATYGITQPTRTGGHPHDVRGIICHRRHEHVIAVGNDQHVRVSFHCATKSTFNLVDFTDAVELISREVKQHQRLGV